MKYLSMIIMAFVIFSIIKLAEHINGFEDTVLMTFALFITYKLTEEWNNTEN